VAGLPADIWRELSAPLPRFDELVRSYLFRQPGHDVSDEPRDPNGQWTSGGGDGGAADSEKPKPSEDYSSLSTMPSSIEGVSIIKKPLGGATLAIGGSAGIAVSTSKRAREIWKDMAAYQQRAFDAGWMSSAHPNHTIWHELAHVKVKNDPDANDSYLSNLRASNNPTFEKIAAKVSKYAKTNGHEFVAEVFAGQRAGRKFDQDVLDYYKSLRGPKS
jgi:hypothetical protein